MTLIDSDPLPDFRSVKLTREQRLLTITLNQPDSLNAVNFIMHEELADVFAFAAADEHSDVVVLTGAGKAFSAGGDLDHIAHNAANPELFENEIRQARRIIYSMLELEKPLVCRMNGHAVGLGATLALFCDVVFAADTAKIGDPHVAIGLVAGDGGAVIWPQLIGFARAKEYLLTGELLGAQKAEDIGLINHCVQASELDAAVAAFCEKLLQGTTNAIRGTKALINLELKRIVERAIDVGLAYESESQRSGEHREGVQALQEKRRPVFSRSAGQPIDMTKPDG